jgi:hypothetical protein
MKELYLAEHLIDELRKGAESEALPRASASAAPVPPKRLKSDGKQRKRIHTDTVLLRAYTDNESS